MRFVIPGLIALCAVSGLTESAHAQASRGQIMIPKSNNVVAGGKRAMHTNLRVLLPLNGKPAPFADRTGRQTAGSTPIPGTFYETPASIACVYKLVYSRNGGCDPNVVAENPQGGIGTIALVDAFDYPDAAADLARFSAQFGLPAANFRVVYADGTRPSVDPTGGWTLESATDIEWAHAMAPQAKIVLVEAASNSDDDLGNAILVAAQLVAAAGGGDVSMSFGVAEFADEVTLESQLMTPGVVYFAAAGDGPGTSWPAASVNVIAAGGTTLSRNPKTGYFLSENTWQDTGGGPSLYEPRPAFQNSVKYLVGPMRGTPDLSFDADPNTGVFVLATNAAGDHSGQPYWYVVGGTSVSSPSLAGIVNAAGGLRSSSQAELSVLYRRDWDWSRSFRDINYGNCGFYAGTFSQNGWDFCSGVGSPLGYSGK